MQDIIEKTVKNTIRPILKKHGGDMELISVQNGICRIRLTGKCSNCPAATITMEELIKKELMKEHPQIKDVVLVDEIDQDMWNFAKQILLKNKASAIRLH